VRDAKIDYYEKSPTTIPAPVIPFEDDPEYHDDDGDDTFGLLEDKTSADEAVCCCGLCLGQKGCGGTLKVLWESSRSPLGPHRGSLWGPHSRYGHHGENPTATTTHPQLMLIFN